MRLRIKILFLAVIICYLCGVVWFRFSQSPVPIEPTIKTQAHPPERPVPQTFAPLVRITGEARALQPAENNHPIIAPRHVDEILLDNSATSKDDAKQRSAPDSAKQVPAVIAPSSPPTEAPTQQQQQQPEGLEGRSVELVIGIPTVPRRNNEDYLLKTLAAIAKDLPSSGLNAVAVVVTHSPVHEVYERAKEQYRGDNRFVFLRVARLLEPNPELGEVDDFNNPDDRPGSKVRQQTADQVNMFRTIMGSRVAMKHYLMMEDDFVVCDGGFAKIKHAIATADARQPGWLSIRFSYGLNAIVVKATDLAAFSDWCWKKISWKPPDILFVEWVAGVEGRSTHGSRTHFTFQENIFTHIGFVSSLRDTRLAHFPGCGEGLNPVLWECEHFKGNCQELSPC